MTYSDKLVELNNESLRKANQFFAAKLLLEQKRENEFAPTEELEENVDLLHLEYEEALNHKNNLKTFISSNRIDVTSGYLQVGSYSNF